MSLINKVKRTFFPTLAERLGYTAEDIIVIVNIDDVGLHKDETDASFNALNCGMVKSGSLMVVCPNFNRAIELWHKNPKLDLGIHLTLTCEWGEKYPWAPVLSEADVPSLVNPEGCMWPTVNLLLEHADKGEVKRELKAQIEMVIDTGLSPSHLDYHMNFHHNPDLMAIIIDLSREYNLLMRFPRRKRYKYPFVKNNLMSLKRRGFVFPDTQMGIYTMEGQDQSLEFRMSRYHDHLRSLGPGVHNIKIHTGYDTQEARQMMGNHYSSVRQIDWDVWTSNKTKQLADELGIVFLDFWPLKKLQGKLT